MRFIGFILFSSVFLFMIGCTGCKKTTDVTDNDITFDSIQAQNTYHLFNDPSKPACNLRINFTYPSDFADKKQLNALQSIFISKYFGDSFANKTPQEAIDAYTKEFIENYKEFETDQEADNQAYEFGDEGRDSSLSYFESSNNIIYFNKGGILSCAVYFENYIKEGAYDTKKIYGYSIDLNTAKSINQKDIFCEDCLDKISSVILKKLAEMNNVSDVKDLENEGFHDVGTITPNNNFLINDQGITYIYNEGDIAPYVMGRMEVFLPYKEISLFLNPQGPVAKLVP